MHIVKALKHQKWAKPGNPLLLMKSFNAEAERRGIPQIEDRSFFRCVLKGFSSRKAGVKKTARRRKELREIDRAEKNRARYAGVSND